MEVQIKLIHKYNSLFVQGVFGVGIQFKHPLAEICEPSKRALIAEAQTFKRNIPIVLGYKFRYDMIIFTSFFKTEILQSRKQIALHQFPHPLKSPICYNTIMLR